MANFSLQHEGSFGSTNIPNIFIEQYMPTAAGEFVKIYIYLLKCINENRSELSISKLADVFNNTEKDTVRALKYWQKKGLLKLTFEDGVLTSLVLNNIDQIERGQEEDPDMEPMRVEMSEEAIEKAHRRAAYEAELARKQAESAPLQAEARPAAETVPAEAPSEVHEKRQYSRSEIAAFSAEDDSQELIYVVQKYLGRNLSGKDVNSIMFMEDELKFSGDLISYLFEYCVEGGHKDMRYIEKTAIAWANDGIKDVNGAKLLNGIYSSNCYPVMKAFGLNGRKPADSEVEYINRWFISYGFGQDMVLEACNRTINAIHQPSFEYAESILRNWKSKGIEDLEGVKAADELFSAKAKAGAAKKPAAPDASLTRFSNFDQRNYDYEALEAKLLNR